MMHLNIRLLSFPLLLLGLASISNSEKCPEKELLYPCECAVNGWTGELKVLCSPNKHELENLRKSLTSLAGKKVYELIITRCRWSKPVATLPSNFFNGLDIKQITIESCEIYGLNKDNQSALLGLENHLEELQIRHSYVARNNIIDLNFGHLEKLKYLYLFENRIKEFGNDWLNDGPVSLEILSLRDNHVEKVGDRAFSNLVNLRELYFHDDVLRSLQRSMFPNPAPRLQYLSLGNNDLKTLPEDIFSNMPALQTVYLTSNGIKRLDQRTWQPVWRQLSTVDLDGNPIKCDDSMEWIFGLGKHPETIRGKCQDRRRLGGRNMDISFYIQLKTQE